MKPAFAGLPVLRTAGLLMAAAGLLGLWHFGAIPGGNRLVQVLHSAAHFPVFGTLAAIVFALLRLHAPGSVGRGTGTYTVTFAIMIAISLATEGLQLLDDRRYASWQDVIVNLLGTAAALGLIGLCEPHVPRSRRAALRALVLGCTAIVVVPVAILGAAYAKRALDFPVLVQFNTPLDMLHVTTPGAIARRARPAGLDSNETTGPPMLLIRLEADRYPGVGLRDPHPDWRGYQVLELELINPDPQPLQLTLRVNDREHDGHYTDRFNQRITLSGRSRNHVRIPVDSIRMAPDSRQMRMDEITMLLLFAPVDTGYRGREFYLGRIELLAE